MERCWPFPGSSTGWIRVLGMDSPWMGCKIPTSPLGTELQPLMPLELLWGGREEHVELQLAAGLAPRKDSGKINYSLLLLNAFSPHSDVWHT